MDYLKENPMERFGSCAICIVHNYDAALGKRRIRDYDNIETKRYLDVIESMLLTNDSGLLCTVLQATRMSDRDSAEFYLMRPETLSSWAKITLKQLPKPALSDGQKLVVISCIRAVPTQEHRNR